MEPIISLPQVICQKVGIDPGDRLSNNTKKRKWLVRLPLPPDSVFPPFQDFEVVHHYLQMGSKEFQARLRKRGQKGTSSNLRKKSLRRFGWNLVSFLLHSKHDVICSVIFEQDSIRTRTRFANQEYTTK